MKRNMGLELVVRQDKQSCRNSEHLKGWLGESRFLLFVQPCELLCKLLRAREMLTFVRSKEGSLGRGAAEAKTWNLESFFNCPGELAGTGRQSGKGPNARPGDPKFSPGSATDWLGGLG